MGKDGVLVSRKWLERVNQEVFKQSDANEVARSNRSLFHDIRPIQIKIPTTGSVWTKEQDETVWHAEAYFIVNDTVDNSFSFPIYAPLYEAPPGATGRAFAIWRGRWELYGEENIRLVRVNSAWSQNEAGTWRATANFIVDGRVDSSYQFQIFAPLASSAPTGSIKMWAIWRGRWESMQTLFAVPKYKGGDHMSIYREPSGEDYVVDNRGLTQVVVINGQGTETSSRLIGPLYLDDAFFQLVNLGAGAKGVSLKLSQINVVTSVQQDQKTGNVTATSARIPVLGFFN